MEKELLQHETLLRFDPKTAFTILSKGHVVHLDFGEITHVCKRGNETLIHTASRRWLTYHPLQEIVNDLPMNEFFRVNKSTVVALREVVAIEKNGIRIGDRWLPLTKYYRREMTRQLGMLLNTQYAAFSICAKP